MKTGIELIAEERAEQVTKHHINTGMDVLHNNHYQLSQGASLLCYIDEEEVAGEAKEDDTFEFSGCAPGDWDISIWNRMMNKPYKERLIIAGALIAAEIDRLQALTND